MRRPNFLLFMTDQHRADHVGCYGNEVVRTPHIDSIAAKGKRFDNFYVACPICTPNRIAMMTCRMPSTNGSRHNGIALEHDSVTFVDLLRAGGYTTALIGKSHLQDMTDHLVSAEDPPANGLTPPPPELSDASRRRRTGPDYERELMPRWIENPDRDFPVPYYGFDHVRLANGHGDLVHGHYDRWLNDRDPKADSLRGWQAALPAPGLHAPQAWRTAVPEELYPTSYIAGETVSYLDNYAAGDREQPFFIHCSFPDPHHPFTPPGHYFDMYDPADMPLSETFDAEGEDEHPFAKELKAKESLQFANEAGPRPFALSDPLAARQIIALTYGMITMIDDGIGRVLAALERNGLAEDTIVIFTSDHGDFMGDHGLMLKHGIHYDGVLRVPFIWSDPDDGAPSTTAQLGGTIDIGPTVLARAGLAPARGTQGIDLICGTGHDQLAARRGVLIEEDELADHLGTDEGMRTRTFVTDRWRLTLYDGLEYGQLFDRQNDPLEKNNLWHSPDHRETRAEMVEAMLREMIRLGDTAPRTVHVA